MTDETEIKEFLSSKPTLTHDPFLLRNMREGVDFLLSAVKTGKRICVYGDYDVDGLAATALLTGALRLLTERVDWYIPSRFDEGYGLNAEALRRIAETGASCVVTVDCGSVAPAEVAYAKTLGLEMLVTDHHNMDGETAPDCLIINPKQPGETYPFAGLAGCGVAFKLVQAIQRVAGLPREILNEALDLVSVATIADIVPLTDENRTIVKYGLKVLNKAARPGLRRLIERTGLSPGGVTSEQVAFILAPHMNAAGRMGDAGEVVELLLARDEETVGRVVENLCLWNAERKRVQEAVFEVCVRAVEADFADDPILIVNAGDAHEGIAGIVAGKLKEKYGRPAIILTRSEADGGGRRFLKGTGRSIRGVDMHALLKERETLFEKFGGHAMACGFLMDETHEARFGKKLLREVGEIAREKPELWRRAPDPDLTIKPADVTQDLVGALSVLEPFGSGNPAPLFAMDGLTIKGTKYMGADGRHARFVADGLNCVLFGRAPDHEEELAGKRAVTLYGAPSPDAYTGRVRFVVRELAPSATGADA